MCTDFVAGLRKVYPYYFSFKTYAKERWFGLPLVSVFVKEFQSYSSELVVSGLFTELLAFACMSSLQHTLITSTAILSSCRLSYQFMRYCSSVHTLARSATAKQFAASFAFLYNAAV